ncbi:Cytochrome bo(3) ubiquinol oxidase subunit 4 [Buchnera aphidicola (Phyllaphis fagi)]|uniref:cytochrome o ubiquinol oxidase subunit IV n=1 Tax=Buchnera aphidicola TaxID=9 RepID=UPI003464654E
MKNDISHNNILNKEIKFYIIGFFISFILTIIPFILVIKKKYFYSKNFLLIVLVLSACLQILVHLKYFLHLNFSKKNYWNLIFLIFSIIVIFIIILGSVWIMWNLHHNLSNY